MPYGFTDVVGRSRFVSLVNNFILKRWLHKEKVVIQHQAAMAHASFLIATSLQELCGIKLKKLVFQKNRIVSAKKIKK